MVFLVGSYGTVSKHLRPKTVARVVATRDLHTSAWHAPTLRRLQMADGPFGAGPLLACAVPLMLVPQHAQEVGRVIDVHRTDE